MGMIGSGLAVACTASEVICIKLNLLRSVVGLGCRTRSWSQWKPAIIVPSFWICMCEWPVKLPSCSHSLHSKSQLFCGKSLIGTHELEVTFVSLALGFLGLCLGGSDMQGGAPAILYYPHLRVIWLLQQGEGGGRAALARQVERGGGWKNSMFFAALLICFTFKCLIVNTCLDQWTKMLLIHWN